MPVSLLPSASPTVIQFEQPVMPLAIFSTVSASGLLRATQPLPGVALRFPHIDRSATRSPHGRDIKEFEPYMVNSGTGKQKYKTINKFLIQD